MNIDRDIISPKFEQDVTYSFFELAEGRLRTPVVEGSHVFNYRFDDESDALEFLTEWLQDTGRGAEMVSDWVLARQTRKIVKEVDVTEWVR